MNPYRHIDGSVGSPKKFFMGMIMAPDGMYYAVHKEMSAGFIPPRWTARCNFEGKDGLERAVIMNWDENDIAFHSGGDKCECADCSILKQMKRYLAYQYNNS